jgi:hypothetical protein
MRQRSNQAVRILAAASGCAIFGTTLFGGGAGATPPVHSGPGTLPQLTFAAKAPTGAKGPDDITRLAVEGLNGGKPLIWTAFQNGINPDGTPGTTGGPTRSTVAGFDPSTAALVVSIPVTGKVDGLTADPERGRLIATVNEDSNSALDLIDPGTATVVTYSYSPDPGGATNAGGTDSIAVRDGRIFIVHSAPSDVTQATEYEVTLVESTHTAMLRSLFFDNSQATKVSGQPTTLALGDPDTNVVMPEASPRFAGQLATVGQADSQIVFGSKVAKLKVLDLMHPPSVNVAPVVDGLAVATSGAGTLYVVDAKAGDIQAFDTSGWPAGTVFVGEPSDNGHPLVGTLDLSTGLITPLTNTFLSPKGLLFVPAPEREDA